MTKQLTKEECRLCLDEFDFRSERPLPYEYNVLNRLIDEYFELKEKATPKKVNKVITPYNYIEFACPNCHKVSHTNFIRPYCGECGQALDWGEDDE